MNLLPEIAESLGANTISPASRGAEFHAQFTLGQVIGRTASRFPNQPAIVSTTFAPLTYGGLQRHLDNVRAQLRVGGFDCNARIGVLMPYGPEAVLAIVAVACCSVAVPLDPRLSPAEINQRLDLLGLNALLVPHGSDSEVLQAAERRGIAVIEAVPVGPGQLGFNAAMRTAASAAIDAEPDPDSPAFILQTSGTTAQPKLIPFSHGNMLAASARVQGWFGLTPQDRCLSVSPPFYSHGLKVTIFTPLLTGGSIAVPASNTIVALDEWFDVLRPTWYSAGPALHAAVLDKAESLEDAQAAHTLRFVVSGGAPLPNAVQDGLQRILGVPVLEHYGSSEAAQIVTNLPPPGPCKPGTCGQAWPGTLAIVGEDRHLLSAGERGEIWIRGPTVFSGYLDAPELNQAAFVDGWFRTGDIGSLDEEGFLTLHGRLSELINRGGDKIAPAEIEAALLRHPAVAEAAAFAISHPRLGEDVAAAVIVRPGAQTTPREIREFLQRQLASFKIPRRIVMLDQLPKGVTGKVQRRRLRESFDGSPDRQGTAAPVVRKSPLDLEGELLTLWRRLLKSEAVTVDDDFFVSGGDSLLAMEMLIELEQLVGHAVPETILFGAETIRQLVEKIDTHIDVQATPTPFLQLHAGGHRPPLYFFNGSLISGHASVRRMVELLGPDYPIISINPHGLRGEPIPPSIEEMAADRLSFILERQASGPFLLGGKCNGAMVAFETARQLMAAGHEVGLVAMVDPPTVNARPLTRTIVRLLKPVTSPYFLRAVFERMAQWERESKHATSAPIVMAGEIPQPMWDPYSILMSRYFPAPLEVPVVFYAAEHEGHGWRRLSSQLDVVQLPWGHHGCLTIGAECMVDHLRQRIDALADSAPAAVEPPASPISFSRETNRRTEERRSLSRTSRRLRR
ncbi:AMP-binding protein [Bradyrhizobium jicamae]|uniref:AMP-binding protein n=1 Tax=Bradyrhizobium jicamae TaxID=280332 RepID=UPI001BAADB3E|nr:AMP-binding protein [Bradyrhizobium jicamae]MBR0751501.1 AMP-binding protein [Bradyrhizobium jicamae]